MFLTPPRPQRYAQISIWFRLVVDWISHIRRYPVAFGYDDVHGHPSCLRFVSTLDICLTSFKYARTMGERNTDHVDQMSPESYLSKIGHRNDQFVMGSQVKQVFYVDDPMHCGWSVVLSMPNREYNDVIGDDVLGDTRIECEPFTRGIPNVDTFDDLVGEFGNENI
ncbi:hypothetical protein L3X38_003453 [Prunus dulcis]|uniref:DUF4216 domain-containing protein n=1 Tax=Prunus dulcis TaxID=3755 RepID=A0AAD4ZM46_PRUDU|nr:hypothetical protein L3X38_003453 [Prunus dulcis]